MSNVMRLAIVMGQMAEWIDAGKQTYRDKGRRKEENGHYCENHEVLV